jgi:hypothetical protein
VIVHYFHVNGISVFNPKADTPLVIDTDAPLTFAVSLQSLQPVAGRRTEVFKPIGIVKHLQLAFGNGGECPILARTLALEEWRGGLGGRGITRLSTVSLYR